MRGRDDAVPGWRVMGCSCGGDASGDFGFDFLFIAVSPRLDFVSRSLSEAPVPWWDGPTIRAAPRCTCA